MTPECKHHWETGYYGDRCTICNIFVVDGLGWWMPLDDDDDDDPSIYRTCESCGGEFWDGGTSCTCED